jgi:hypothetical protein
MPAAISRELYSRLRKSIMAVLTSGGRSCWLQCPQPGRMIVRRSWGTNFTILGIRWRMTATRGLSLATQWRSWPEPFGLVLIEAMANGIPVIAFGRGFVPEIIGHGVTGFIVDSVDEAVAAIPLRKRLIAVRSAAASRSASRWSAWRAIM